MAIFQRGKNTYRIESDLGFDSNGKRKRIYETFNGNKKEAKARESEIKNQIKSGLYVDNNNLTYEMFIYKWLKDYAEPTLAPKTLSVYKARANDIIKQLGSIKIKNLRPLHLIEFYNHLRDREKPKRLSPKTIRHYYMLNNTILNHAVKWQIIVNNPNTKVDKPKIIKKEAKYYDIEQTKKLIKCLENEKPKYRALILLALDTGARRGELTGLEWEDVDFKKNIITINKTTQYVDNKIIEKLPKNESSIRKVYITPVTGKALKEYKKEQELLKKKTGNKWKNTKKVFTTLEGDWIHPDTASKIFEKIINKYNLPKISFHSLRHTSVSLLIASGIHTQVISKRVGHSSASTTQNIYSHVFESVASEVTDKMNEILTQ